MANSEREKVSGQMVRAVIVRDQILSDWVDHNRPQVLVLQRPVATRRFARAEWQLTGGGMYPEETKLQAVRRSIREEIGLRGLRLHDIGSRQNPAGYETQFYVAKAPLAKVKKMKVDMTKIQGYKWLETDESHQPIVEEANEYARAVLTLTLAFETQEMIVAGLDFLANLEM